MGIRVKNREIPVPPWDAQSVWRQQKARALKQTAIDRAFGIHAAETTKSHSRTPYGGVPVLQSRHAIVYKIESLHLIGVIDREIIEGVSDKFVMSVRVYYARRNAQIGKIDDTRVRGANQILAYSLNMAIFHQNFHILLQFHISSVKKFTADQKIFARHIFSLAYATAAKQSAARLEDGAALCLIYSRPSFTSR
jgi:hypothetical protein